jgi:hypothetical protein
LHIPQGHDLIPHKSNAFDLVFFDTTSNVRMDVYEALAFSSSIVDYDSASILIICMTRHGKISSESLSALFLFDQSQTIVCT